MKTKISIVNYEKPYESVNKAIELSDVFGKIFQMGSRCLIKKRIPPAIADKT